MITSEIRIEREAEENQTDFDFSLVMSETESENETDHLHHHVKHLAETPQKSTRKRGGHTGRGRGRGRKRSSTTMIAESLTHSPAKPSLVTNTNDQVITSASDATSQVAALNVSTDIQSTSGTLPSTAPNGTPVKKKRGVSSLILLINATRENQKSHNLRKKLIKFYLKLPFYRTKILTMSII